LYECIIGENQAADSRGVLLPARGCIKKVKSNCENASKAAEGKMSMGENALVKSETKELRHADRERDTAASFAAMLNCEGSQERGQKESSDVSMEEALEEMAGARKCVENVGNELAGPGSARRSLPAYYILAGQQGRELPANMAARTDCVTFTCCGSFACPVVPHRHFSGRRHLAHCRDDKMISGWNMLMRKK
jgi:hypothetical protein